MVPLTKIESVHLLPGHGYGCSTPQTEISGDRAIWLLTLLAAIILSDGPVAISRTGDIYSYSSSFSTNAK
jgi:hypothetical protein